MKRFWASSFVVCALLGVGGGTPAGIAATVRHITVAPARGTAAVRRAAVTPAQVTAAVRHVVVTRAPVAATVRHAAVAPARVVAAIRHLPIDHSPAPPLRTIEISTANPTPTAVPNTSATACAGTPPSDQVSSATCDPKNQELRLEVVRLPAP